MAGAHGIVLNENGELLLVKRRDYPVWTLPGGGIDDGETPEQAVVREIFEESGFTTKITKTIGVYDRKNTRASFVFQCKILSGKPTTSKESKAVEFFPLKGLPRPRSPIVDFILEDFLTKTHPVSGPFHSLTKEEIRYFITNHPIISLRYLLATQGIHINW